MTKPKKAVTPKKAASKAPDRVTDDGDPEGKSIGNKDDSQRGRHRTPNTDTPSKGPYDR